MSKESLLTMSRIILCRAQQNDLEVKKSYSFYTDTPGKRGMNSGKKCRQRMYCIIENCNFVYASIKQNWAKLN